MSKVYFPLRFIDVPASPPHDSDPAYRVSVGIEHWADGAAQHVYKIQMAYGGRVVGRKTPSFPEGTDDLERVYAAMAELKAGKGRSGRGMIEAVGEEPGIPLAEAHNLLKALAESLSQNSPGAVVRRGRTPGDREFREVLLDKSTLKISVSLTALDFTLSETGLLRSPGHR